MAITKKLAFYIGLSLMMIGAWLTVTSPTPVLAFSGGISGFSGQSAIYCTNCHGGGTVPTVMLSGPTSLNAGQTGTYTFSIQSTNVAGQTHSGLNVSADGGTFAVSTGDVQIMNAEVTHTASKANDAAGLSSFTFDWTAPNTSGTYTLFGAGNSVDNMGSPGNDGAEVTTFQVTVNPPLAVSISETNVATSGTFSMLVLVLLTAVLGAITYKSVKRCI